MVQAVAVSHPGEGVGAFIVGVDAQRKAPGLKLLGLEKDATVRAVLDNKDIALPFKGTRALLTPAGWVVLVGLGDKAKLTQEKVGTVANLGARACGGLGVTVAATTLLGDMGGDVAVTAQALTHGLVIGSLDFDQWKSKPAEYKPADTKARELKQEPPRPAVKLQELRVLVPAGAKAVAVRKAVERAQVLGEAVNDARLLANTPANIANPRFLASEAQARGKKAGLKVSVKGREQLRKEGYGALCGVAQGSVNEEQLITMEYTPKGATSRTKTVCIVGKGVCFDSGGISIKPGDKMWEMKYDKSGACNVIALMAALPALGVKHRVIGIVAAVENMPSGTAQRPGDIVTAKDGTTIEVLNTDAEGRLILADAMAHARTFEPAWIVDLATLTGACDVAVGPTFVAAMGNDEAFARKVVAASLAAGDKAWLLPQGEEFDEANKGAYADLQNISLTIRAGSSIGGSFIKHFAKDTVWAHLDIASKAWTAGSDYFAKGPTGAGTRIVAQLLLDT